MPGPNERPFECIPQKNGITVLPKCRLSYPKVWEPALPPGETDPKKARYSSALIFPPPAVFKPLLLSIDAAVKAQWGPTTKGIKNPILKHSEKTQDADLARNFPHLIRCASKYRPHVCYPNGNEVEDHEQVYPGRWARVSVRIFCWNHPVGGKGVSIGLNNILLLEDDEVLGGGRTKVVDDFEGMLEEEGGEEQSSDSVFG